MTPELELITSILEKQKDCEFSLRFMVRKDKDQWKNCFTILKLVKTGNRKKVEWNYGKYVLAENILTINEGMEILNNLCKETGGRLVIPGYGEFTVNPNEKYRFLESKEQYGFLFDEWPIRFCSFNIAMDQIGTSDATELLKSGLPYYPEASSAVISFFELPVNFFNSYGMVYVLIPDYRARVEFLRLMFSKVELKLGLPELELKNLLVKGFAQTGSNIFITKDIYPENNSVMFDIGFNPEKLNVALILREDNIKIDGKEYSPYRTEKGVIIERPGEEILFLAKAGESQNLEYKGDIISDENRNDLVETVIAFSNTNNGIILIGVANDGQIIGSSRNPDDISKVIHDSCDPPPQNVKIEERNVSGNRVIIVEVPKGDDPPYQSKRDKNWYVRHSANDMRMERSELIRMLNDVRAKL